MKIRLTCLDVAFIVHELEGCQGLVGMRLHNIYSLSNNTQLFKFTRPDHKLYIIHEQPFRFHPTSYEHVGAFESSSQSTPSFFVQKLKKQLRDRRVTAINQVGFDRIIRIEFGHDKDPLQIRILWIELYSMGNVILTDADNKVILLQRVVFSTEEISIKNKKEGNEKGKGKGKEKELAGETKKSEKKFLLNIGMIYELPPKTDLKVQEILNSNNSQLNEEISQNSEMENIQNSLKSIKKDGKFKPKDFLKKHFPLFSPVMIDHVIANSSPYQIEKEPNELINCANNFILSLRNLLEKTGNEQEKSKIKGYINQTLSKEDSPISLFEDFSPFLPSHWSNYLIFDSFSQAVDEYFSKVEKTKISQKLEQQEKEASSKINAIKLEQQSRITSLQNQIESNRIKAQLIESNKEIIDETIHVIRSAQKHGMDWKEFDKVLLEEQKKGTKTAKIIKSLKLEKNQISLSLKFETDQFDDEEDNQITDNLNSNHNHNLNSNHNTNTDNQSIVDIRIELSSHGNADWYYEIKRQQILKLEKTISIHNSALASAETKIRNDLKKNKQKNLNLQLANRRKVFWFEKFWWFISSDRYLVIAGRDQQQNEILVKRYLRKGDVYVHADMTGAASVVIRNRIEMKSIPSGLTINSLDSHSQSHSQETESIPSVTLSTGIGYREPPPKTLIEAGNMSLCFSRAWDAKIVTSAWWVWSDQVSKTAPTGEYLSSGSFMIRGRKNFLMPSQITYGYGLAFILDEEATEQRRKARQSAELAMTRQQSTNMERRDEILEELTEKYLLMMEIVQGDHDGNGNSNSNEQENKNLNKKEKLKSKRNQLENVKSLPLPSLNQLSLEPDQRDQKEELKAIPSQFNSSHSQSKSLNSLKAFPKEESTMKNGEKSKRGKHGKLKKIKEKYRDQDEEERTLMMERIGRQTVKMENSKESKVKQVKESKVKTGNEPFRKQEIQNENIENSELPLTINSIESIKESREKSNLSINKLQEIKDGNNDLDDEDDQEQDNKHSTFDDTDLLDCITGNPMESEIIDNHILYALPISAPLSSLSSHICKIKLIPGGLKKGKACKLAINHFLNEIQSIPFNSKSTFNSNSNSSNSSNGRLKDLIKACSENDQQTAMLGKVSLSGPTVELNKIKKQLKKDFIFSSTKLRVPADHDNPSSSPKINVFVRRICRVKDGNSKTDNNDPLSISPDWNILAIPGGPGQSSIIYEQTFNNFNNLLEGIGSFCLYGIDHRGIGRSTRFIKAISSGNWYNSIQDYLNNPKFPLKTCTVTNAARDTLQLANLLTKDEANKKGKKSKMVIYGSSYGSFLAHRILTLDPNMFDKAIFESYSVAERHTVDSDEGLLLSCKRSKACTGQLGTDPRLIRNVLSFLSNENYNECSKILNAHANQSQTKDGGGSNKCSKIVNYLIDRKSVKSARFGLALLYHAWSCPDAIVFGKALNKFESIKGNSGSDDEEGKKMIVNESASSSSTKTNQMLRDYLHWSEISAPYIQSPPSNCQSECAMGLNNNCEMLLSLKSVYKFLENYLYSYDHSKREASINSKKTKIYIVHGGEDLITPIRTAKREFDRIKSPLKRMFIINNGGHTLAETNKCSREIYDEIFRDGHSGDTDHCIQELNKSRLENDLFEFKRDRLEWFWPAIKKELPLNSKDNNENPLLGKDWFDLNLKTGKSFSWSFKIILIVLGVLVTVSILGMVIFLKRKNRLNQDQGNNANK